MRFSLIIATKERPVPLSAALESAAEVLPPNCEVIVVDGDAGRSAEPVVEQLQAKHPQVTMRYLVSAPGAALQRNVGIDAALGDVVAFTDDDCTFERGLFRALSSAYEDPLVIGVTGRVEAPEHRGVGGNPHSRLRLLLLGGGRQGTMTSFGFRRPIVDMHEPRDVEFMPGPLMTARREHAAAVRFDERLAAYSLGEDDDFSYRLSRRGRIRYVPEAVVYHHELGWRNIDRRKMDRLRVVNHTYLFRKNYRRTWRARAGFARHICVLFAHRLLNRQWSGMRGLLEGMWHVRRSRGRGALPPR